MAMKSINEPDTPTREIFLTPASPNREQPTAEDIAKLTPIITALVPTEATIGEETFTLYIEGEGFVAESVIVFAGQEEPTTLADGKVSTIVDMDYWHGPDTLPVLVKNGPLQSNPLYFTFHAAPEADAEAHRGRPTRTLPNKRKR